MTDQSELAAANPAATWPVPIIPMPAAYVVEPALSSDGSTPLVVIGMYTPSGAIFAQFTRDDALALASQIRTVAHTGPERPEPAASSGLVVPGR